MSVSSYKVKNGRNWKFVIPIRNPLTGKREDICRGGFSKKSDARLAEARYRDGMEHNNSTFGLDSTLDDIFAYWLMLNKKKGTKEQTLKSYVLRYKGSFGEKIGKKKINRVTTQQLQQIVDELTPKYTSMANHMSLINSVFKLALNGGIIRINPMTIVIVDKSKLKSNKNEIEKYMNSKELRKFFHNFELKNKDGKCDNNGRILQEKLLFSLLALTGMRIGEALALEWSDIDLSERKIIINKTQVSINGEQKISTTKTDKSNRQIPILSDYLVNLFKNWKKVQLKAQENFYIKNEKLKNSIFYNMSQNKRYTNAGINNKIKRV